jgi:hypothetical protein
MVRAAGASEESPPLPDPEPMPSVVEGVDRTDALAQPAEQPRATPHSGVLKKPHTGGAPIRLFPPLASGAEAGPITTGDER